MIKVKDYLDEIVSEVDVKETPVTIAIAEELKKKINVLVDSGKNLHQLKSFVDANALPLLDEVVRESFSTVVLNEVEKEIIVDRLKMNMFGFGVIEPFLRDDTVNEIMVNSYDVVFIEKNGKVIRARDHMNRPVSFRDEKELKNIIERIITPLNRTVSESSPIVDGRLPSGYRVNAILHPVAIQGTSLTIRKFPEIPFTFEDLIQRGSVSTEMRNYLQEQVMSRQNIIVSGGTSSGKTTFLNVLSSEIPDEERVITIEDSAELKFSQVENIIRLEGRPKNMEGAGEITIRDLVKNSLRMRPDRIIVGEVRGGEALDMLQAMNTGHDGSLTTLHANSALDTISRLETMVLMSNANLPILAIRNQISSAVDVIVYLKRYSDGIRRVSEIYEVCGLKDGEIHLMKKYEYS